jgi:DivIVA domain-containing protein
VVTVLEILAVLIVLFVAAAVATREGEVLVDAPRDAADLALPGGPVHPEDVARVRFGLTVRGYRMAEVDRVLERLAEELAVRDARVAELESVLGAGEAPGSQPAPLAPPAPLSQQALESQQAHGSQQAPGSPPAPTGPEPLPGPVSPPWRGEPTAP